MSVINETRCECCWALVECRRSGIYDWLVSQILRGARTQRLPVDTASQRSEAESLHCSIATVASVYVRWSGGGHLSASHPRTAPSRENQDSRPASSAARPKLVPQGITKTSLLVSSKLGSKQPRFSLRQTLRAVRMHCPRHHTTTFPVFGEGYRCMQKGGLVAQRLQPAAGRLAGPVWESRLCIVAADQTGGGPVAPASHF
ncbi:uncharacterized protein CC84DRAFT_1021063 [Paraphaeosphaeria sporulosa]|uniref:Uncharacterized protein n=1 Tax=Paraphaeosphaeria sporulosa TaxID=1460663 RepID=A0A177C4T7_9PLEO|nr:uncharacterized protein CC84DRAFT_1021063 [Paraphaeosphaeria sporulosa]OAG02436.1 hypothetical protein CC84DRAFT_1021063 [Paraphaeosphaeria sporulosa]